ncbi:hypothetical protein SAY87_023872 [Trapa incisa]|uniref:Protein FATTY ACID EXPORT 3, chloroplastic n=1 Tax=Trapa incisa TaxID=236973 RepID=A0AAN7L749_9MYRT|nr:hypothetical protein SAY87_023872 [Trapa incisa]
MSVAAGSILVRNLKPCSPTSASHSLSLPYRAPVHSPLPTSLRQLGTLPLRGRCHLSLACQGGTFLNGLASGLLPLHLRNRSLITLAASHDESKHVDDGVKEEQADLKGKAEEPEEAWEQALATFKEQALKMKSISQEAYEIYSKKAMFVLRETAEQLKIQAEKAKYDFSIVAKEIGEEGKEYLSAATENYPEPVKEIVETFSSPTDDLKDVTQVRDFYVGIPYGSVLSLGGFLSFMITGSIAAVRFGVILGGILLALSILSLRSYRREEKASPLALKGQAGIAGVLFLREVRLFSQGPSLWSFITSIISGAVLAFYLYRIKQNGLQDKTNYESGNGNAAD